MMAFRTILVGLDLRLDDGHLTRGSRRAVDQALWLAGKDGARLVLLHSTASDASRDPLAGSATLVTEGLPPAGAATLEALLETCRSRGVAAELVVQAEEASLAIAHEVQRRRVDLVVVGKRSDDGRDGRLVGNVAMKLLRKCPSAVWVVKADAPEAPRRIVAASDLTAVGGVAICHGARLADLAGAELHVVHAWQLSMGLIHERELVDDAEHERHLRERQEAALAGLREQLRDTGWKDRARFDVQCTTPNHLILEAVARVHADLVVMGTISRGGVPGLLLGNTAERLLPRLDCSVLTVKPDDFVCPASSPDDSA